MADTRVPLGSDSLRVFPLTLGGDVFGWTADEQAAWSVLDAYTEAGGNFVDTADTYASWVPGNSGGESETIIGRWLARRGRRDDVVIASKVSKHPELLGLAPATIRKAIDNSLARLGTDHIDLYYAHFDDPDVPVDEFVGALSALVDEGKVRHLGASNFSAGRLREWLDVSERHGYHPLTAYQPFYNLLELRFEAEERPVLEGTTVGVVPYSALAGGFLTGKYRDGVRAESGRSNGTSRYLDARGRAVLAAIDEVAAAHDTSPTAVSIAWLRQQPTVVAPITSARRPDQLTDVMYGATLDLTDDELASIRTASTGRTAAATGITEP